MYIRMYTYKSTAFASDTASPAASKIFLPHELFQEAARLERFLDIICTPAAALSARRSADLSNLSAALVSLASRFCPTAAALVAKPLVRAEGQPVTCSEKSAPWNIYYTGVQSCMYPPCACILLLLTTQAYKATIKSTQ